MAYTVFISFDNKDRDLAGDLSKRLDKAGLIVLSSASKVDNPRDDVDRIKNLEKADQVIFLITSSAIDGEKVFFDLGVADALEKQLVPVLVGLRPKDLPGILKGLDFIKYDKLEGYINNLQRKVGEAAKTSARAQPKSGERSKSAA